MSDFVENGVARIRDAFGGMSSVDPADVARVFLEYLEEQQAAASAAAPAPPSKGST